MMLLALLLSCASPVPGPLAEPSLPGIGTPDVALTRQLQVAASETRVPAHHVDEGGAPRFTNRLITATSPYLLQHAHNPVNWWPWGEEAFARAKALNRPVLLSVGYSTCHWCHVMERESFEDLEVAAFINGHFVAIKVDREERPDIDDVYMSVVHALHGQGGWPMTLVLTPEGEAYFAATYLPARDGERGRSKGLLTVLTELAHAYAEDPAGVVHQAAQITAKVGADRPAPTPGVPAPNAVVRVAQTLTRSFDALHGGFGRAPKFPRPATLDLLLRYHRRTSDPHALTMVTRTLEEIDRGGLHDHLGGGFHRYSTDDRWHVPHFEKMLYDQAQLIRTYTAAWQVTGREDFREVVRDTVTYLLTDMRDPRGGFWAATDADSLTPSGEVEEGWYYTWTREELQEALGPADAGLWALLYGVRSDGSRHALYRTDPKRVHVGMGVPPEVMAKRVADARSVLRTVRAARPAPRLDDKVVAAWNGLTVSALARAGAAMEEPEWVLAAEQAAAFVLAELLGPDGRHRTWRRGATSGPATLDDLAFTTHGLLDLYQATGDPRWVAEARELHQVLRDRFADPAGGWFLTPSDGEALLYRPKPDHDGAEPTGNAVAADNALWLYHLTADDTYRQEVEGVLKAYGEDLQRRGDGLATLMGVVEAWHDRTLEVVIVHDGDGGGSLREALRARYAPHVVLSLVREQDVADHAAVVPVVADKVMRDGLSTAYVCEGGVCQQPVTSPEALLALLGDALPLVPGVEVPPLVKPRP